MVTLGDFIFVQPRLCSAALISLIWPRLVCKNNEDSMYFLFQHVSGAYSHILRAYTPKMSHGSR